MCAKYEDISPVASPQQKLPLLSSQEMRNVLADLQGASSLPQDEEEEEETEFSRVLGEIPDLEGDCSILSLGWNEDLGLEKGDFIEEGAKESSHLVSLESKVGESSESERKESPKKDISCWSKVKTREKAVSDPVPVQKGDMLEFLVEERKEKTWFLVEVTGRGKAGGKNRNYLNVKYSDGSEGGVFIDKHQWRIVKRKEEQEEMRAECSVRLHRVTVGDPGDGQENVEVKAVEKSTDEDRLLSEREHAKERSQPGNVRSESKDRKKKGTRKKTENVKKHDAVLTGAMEKSLLKKSVLNLTSSIRRGDILEYLVEEEEEEDTWFRVEVLGRGKASGKNRNYLNVRYTDGSEGGVFINKHQWRIIRRADDEGKLHEEWLKE